MALICQKHSMEGQPSPQSWFGWAFYIIHIHTSYIPGLLQTGGGLGGLGGLKTPQFLADQLTLSQPGGTLSQTSTTSTQRFWSFDTPECAFAVI